MSFTNSFHDEHQGSTMILLVDDQAVVGEFIRRMLSDDPGIDIHFCSEGKNAIKTARRLSPHLILQDLVMPDVDGLDIVAEYRKHLSLQETPIVVLSGKEDPAIKKKAFEAGANDYLVKPPDPIELLARVKYHVAAYHTRLRLRNALASLRESQRQLLDRNAALESLNEQKNRLLGMAAHDMRNPLGVIMAYSDFLETEAASVLDPTQMEFVNTIKTTSEFMLNMINDLLDVSTIESGQLRLSLSPVNLSELVRHNLNLNRVLAHQKQIDLLFSSPPELPDLLLDKAKIEQVLNNLIGNAVKYSHANTKVTVEIFFDGSMVHVSVADQGQGIPQEDLTKLFKPFGKANVRTTGGEQSTGLGLAIARKIVEGHGGRMYVKSTVGEGSTFSFTLPVAPATPCSEL